MFEIKEVSGIGGYKTEDVFDAEERKTGELFRVDEEEGKVFLVLHLNTDESIKTIEVRTDSNLAKTLEKDYESVMESRYFGRGGIEIVMSGQLSLGEIYDIVRLSYNLSREEVN